MATFINFVPTKNSPPFQFQATLDGEIYNVVITWNLSGQRFYFNVYDLSQNLILCRALVGSPAGFNVESLSWANGYVTLTTVDPHGFNISDTVQLTVSDCAPAAYNGQFNCFVTGATTMEYPLSADPGDSTGLGLVACGINLVGSNYFTKSSLVFLQEAQQFVISP